VRAGHCLAGVCVYCTVFSAAGGGGGGDHIVLDVLHTHSRPPLSDHSRCQWIFCADADTVVLAHWCCCSTLRPLVACAARVSAASVLAFAWHGPEDGPSLSACCRSPWPSRKTCSWEATRATRVTASPHCWPSPLGRCWRSRRDDGAW